MGLYEILCVKLLKIVKYYRIQRILHSIKKERKKKREIDLPSKSRLENVIGSFKG